MIILERRFNQENNQNANQEEYFCNYSSFNSFNQNNEIFNIDDWKSKSIIGLVSYLKKFSDQTFIITFKRWNKNLEVLFKNFNPQINYINITPDLQFQKLLKAKDLNSLLILFKSYSEEQQIYALMDCLQVEFDLELALKINESFNLGILNPLNLFYLFLIKNLDLVN